VDEGSGAGDVTDDSDIYYFYLPHERHRCACIQPSFGPSCEFQRFNASVSGGVSFQLTFTLELTGPTLLSWSAENAVSLLTFTSRLLTHFVGDVVAQAPVLPPASTRRSVVDPVRITINVTNIESFAQATVLRDRVAELGASTFPGFILAARINASSIDAVQPFGIINTTSAADSSSGGGNSNDEVAGVPVVVLLVVASCLLAVLVVVVLVTVVRDRRHSHDDPNVVTNRVAHHMSGVAGNKSNNNNVTTQHADTWGGAEESANTGPLKRTMSVISSGRVDDDDDHDDGAQRQDSGELVQITERTREFVRPAESILHNVDPYHSALHEVDNPQARLHHVEGHGECISSSLLQRTRPPMAAHSPTHALSDLLIHNSLPIHFEL
jgi:hypothetical protein